MPQNRLSTIQNSLSPQECTFHVFPVRYDSSSLLSTISYKMNYQRHQLALCNNKTTSEKLTNIIFLDCYKTRFFQIKFNLKIAYAKFVMKNMCTCGILLVSAIKPRQYKNSILIRKNIMVYPTKRHAQSIGCSIHTSHRVYVGCRRSKNRSQEQVDAVWSCEHPPSSR